MYLICGVDYGYVSICDYGVKMSIRASSSLVNSGDDSFDFLFKIVLIGDCGAGKTCVVQRFKSGTFVERHGNTIGVDFSMKTVIVDGKRVKVSFSRVVLCVKYTKTSFFLVSNVEYLCEGYVGFAFCCQVR
jgi:GTPase SAR1 family protein